MKASVILVVLFCGSASAFGFPQFAGLFSIFIDFFVFIFI